MSISKEIQKRHIEMQAKKDSILHYFKKCSVIKDYYKIACEKDLEKYKHFMEKLNKKGDLE